MRYIGSKRLLIEDIQNILEPHLRGNEESFLDLFGGTNVVAAGFKPQYRVITNDLLYFSFLHAKATLENNVQPKFKRLKRIGVMQPLQTLTEFAESWIKEGSEGYYELAYSPSGGAMYLSVENAKRVDAIRSKIEEWKENELLTEIEYAYLVSALVQAIPRVSNITGTYGAFLKKWDKRSYLPLELEPLIIIDNGKENQSFNQDAILLADTVIADIIYIDTPYNTRQYASNYHLLENVARNDKPKLKGKTKIFDWSDLKSDFAMQKRAEIAMEQLLENIHAKHVVLSYNTEGIIPEDELLKLIDRVAKEGSVVVQRIPYRKYKSKLKSSRDSLYELLVYFKPSRGDEDPLPQKSVDKVEATTVNRWIPTQGKLLKSPLNYVGGKYRLLKQILPYFPDEIETYVEPFGGAGNVGINVQADYYIFNDMNSELIAMLQYLTAIDDVEALIQEIYARIEAWGLTKTSESAYKEYRKFYNSNRNPLDLFILTCFSYNYQLRFNNQMEYNNPFGRNRSSFSNRTETNLRRFVARLQEMDVEFRSGFFQNMNFSSLGPQDFVYLDPPYLITTGSYNDGNRGFRNWSVSQEADLYNLLHYLSENGVRWALSNVIEHKGKTNEMLQRFVLSEGVNLHELTFSYINSSYNTTKSGSKEVLVTNY
ncbi:Dam family site-specific DNA-(adenine-N6)-methyltransferase [Corynebacterium accolens]|uniref:Dam family site-specific DNA-(adenine-N6)-methyltransferase n=1 Tax=Corynebacterium accolens TaxID=38284 RepID=UPI001EDAF6B5|nr:Dam family site-specific DNA-(adenine-N6)-methyltransferase [Corynebacterium accolens]